MLIFEQTPKPNLETAPDLTYQQLVERGRTFQYFDLPDRLWATTGLILPELELYREFGKLRNAVQHFSPPQDVNLSQKTLEFTFGVIDAFIHECWGLYAIDYNEDHEEYVYFVPGIIGKKILFNVSSESVTDLQYMDISWPEDDGYRREMEKRINKALLEDKGQD